MNKIVTTTGAVVITIGLLSGQASAAGSIAADVYNAAANQTPIVQTVDLKDMSSFARVGAVATANNFKDVPSSHWASAAINKAIADGLVKGYEDGTFRPNASVTRAEMATVLIRATSMKPESNVPVFNDVPSNYWGAQAINEAVSLGFISPMDYNGKFAPNTAMTRYELARWLSSGLAKSNDSYARALVDTRNTIVPFTEYYRGGISKTQAPYLAVALGSGVIGGFPDGSFGLNKTTTRAEMVAMVYRYLAAEGKEATSYQALNELCEVGTTGTNIISLGGKWNLNIYGAEAKYSEVRGKEWTLLNNRAGIVVPNYYILIDSFRESPTSVYTNMFTGDLPATSKGYRIYSNVTYTSLKDDKTAAGFRNIADFLVGSPLSNTDNADKYSLTYLPAMFTPAVAARFNAGKTQNIWTMLGTSGFDSILAGNENMNFSYTIASK